MGTFNQEAWAVDVEPVAPGPTLADELGAHLTMTSLFGGVAPWIDQRFVIRKILSAGGFGMVCLAHDRFHGGDVALKILLQSPGANVSMTTSLREATSLQRCNHPSIVGVIDARHGTLAVGSRHYAVTWVAMNLVHGRELDKWLDAPPPKSALQVVFAMLQIADALRHAHESGVIHRDLKPSNILIDDAGRATLVDFGLALASDHESAAASGRDALGTRVTRTGETRGTPIYMAPEAAAGLPSAASDQYSLALVLREALTGAHPMLPNAAPSIAPHDGAKMATRLGDVLRRAMAGVALDRYPSMAEFAGALAIASGVGPDWRARVGLAATHRRAPAAAPAPTPAHTAGSRRASAATALDEDVFDRHGARHMAMWVIGGLALAAIGIGGYFVAKQRPPDAMTAAADGNATIAGTSLTCADLTAFAGEWSIASAVEWAAFADHYPYTVPYRLTLTPGDGCNTTIGLVQTIRTSESKGHTILAEHRATVPVVARVHEGALVLRARIDFERDELRGKNYANSEGFKEHEEMELRLSSRPAGGGGFTPVVEGVTMRRDSQGGDVRRTRLHVARGSGEPAIPPPSVAMPCWAACELECAGASAISACRSACSEPSALEAPSCTAPSGDFHLPTRLRRQRSELTEGDASGLTGTLRRACEQTGGKMSSKTCTSTISALAGDWTIHGLDGPNSVASLTLTPSSTDGVETMRGTLLRDGTKHEVAVQVSQSGAWRVASASMARQGSVLGPFPPFLVVGGAQSSPRAFGVGVTLASPEHKLRVTRRNPAP